MKNIIRKPAVIKKTGLSYSTIYRKIKAGTFPAPVILGPGAIGWIEDEVDQYISDLPRGGADIPVEAISSRKLLAG